MSHVYMSYIYDNRYSYHLKLIKPNLRTEYGSKSCFKIIFFKLKYSLKMIKNH